MMLPDVTSRRPMIPAAGRRVRQWDDARMALIVERNAHAQGKERVRPGPSRLEQHSADVYLSRLPSSSGPGRIRSCLNRIRDRLARRENKLEGGGPKINNYFGNSGNSPNRSPAENLGLAKIGRAGRVGPWTSVRYFLRAV